MSTFSSIFGGSGSSAAGSAAPHSSNLDAIKKDLEAEFATANVTELVSKMTEACFEKCPSGSQQEISICAQKYLQSWEVISNTYLQAVKNHK